MTCTSQSYSRYLKSVAYRTFIIEAYVTSNKQVHTHTHTHISPQKTTYYFLHLGIRSLVHLVLKQFNHPMSWKFDLKGYLDTVDTFCHAFWLAKVSCDINIWQFWRINFFSNYSHVNNILTWKCLKGVFAMQMQTKTFMSHCSWLTWPKPSVNNISSSNEAVKYHH